MDILKLFIKYSTTLGVFLQVGFGTDFWINVVLNFFGYIPGIIHAVIIPLRDRKICAGNARGQH